MMNIQMDLQQFDQSGENSDGDDLYTAKTDCHALFHFFHVALQGNFQFPNVALHVQNIPLGGKVVLNQVCLFFGQNFGLRFRHSGGGQSFNEVVGIKGQCVHAANIDTNSRNDKPERLIWETSLLI